MFGHDGALTNCVEFLSGGCWNRYQVARTVWPYMVSIGLAYFVTLCLFPGIESEIVSCKLKSWMPVILIGIFNLFDFIGKVSTPTQDKSHLSPLGKMLIEKLHVY